jgi:hypothetical protein
VGLKLATLTDDQTKPVKVRQVQTKIGGILPRDGRMRGGGVNACENNFSTDFHQI